MSQDKVSQDKVSHYKVSQDKVSQDLEHTSVTMLSHALSLLLLLSCILHTHSVHCTLSSVHSTLYTVQHKLII